MEIVQRSLLRENSGSMQFVDTKEVSSRSLRDWTLFATFSGWKVLQNQLVWCLVKFQHDCMASTIPKVKKSSSWKTSSVLKEEFIYVRLHFTQTESHEANITVESRTNFNYPRRETY